MCGVFYIDQDSVLEVRKFVTEVDQRIPTMDFSRDIHPTDPAPVITGSRNVLKEKNLFSRVDGKVLYLAGFFDLMENEERFVILTTGANESMSVVHDRMPLVLEEPQVEDWILNDSSTEKLLCQVPGDLKRQADFEQMTLFAD